MVQEKEKKRKEKNMPESNVWIECYNSYLKYKNINHIP